MHAAVAPARRDLGRAGALEAAAPVDAVDDRRVRLRHVVRGLREPLEVPDRELAGKVAGGEVPLGERRVAKGAALERLGPLELGDELRVALHQVVQLDHAALPRRRAEHDEARGARHPLRLVDGERQGLVDVLHHLRLVGDVDHWDEIK